MTKILIPSKLRKKRILTGSNFKKWFEKWLKYNLLILVNTNMVFNYCFIFIQTLFFTNFASFD